VGPWLTAFAYGTSYFSAVVFVGYAGQFGWGFGVAATWIGLGNAFLGSLLPWVILGRRTRVMTKHFESATMPDFFAKRYKSASLKVVSSLIIFIFLIPYSASVYKGLSSFCHGVRRRLHLLRRRHGGDHGHLRHRRRLHGDRRQRLVQGIIMLGGIVAVVFAVLHGQGGFTAAIEKLSQIQSAATPSLSGAYVSFFGPDPLNLLGVVILTSLGTWGLPQMIHKFYAIKNEKSIKAGTIISTVFALVIAGGSYFMGAFGRLYYTPGADGKVVFDNIVPQMLSGSLSDVLIGIVVVLVLSASMSPYPPWSSRPRPPSPWTL
jgi:SSS family solute:Na+ symporter